MKKETGTHDEKNHPIWHTDIPHRIEPARPWDLNEREARALEGYRRLTEKQRRSVELIIEAFLGE